MERVSLFCEAAEVRRRSRESRQTPMAFVVLLVVLGVAAGCAHQPPLSAEAAAVTGDPGSTGLWGTAWRLEDLAGTGVLDRVQATLEFLEPGKVAGRASCNRFFGSVRISGDSIAFGAIGATRMACGEAIDRQEASYLKALQDAVRFTLDGATLTIFVKGTDKPLRFTRSKPAGGSGSAS